MPLSGMLISRIEDGENLRNAFEISGALFIQATFFFYSSVVAHNLRARKRWDYQCIP